MIRALGLQPQAQGLVMGDNGKAYDVITAVEGRSPYPEQRNPIALLQKIAAEEPAPLSRAGALTGPIGRMMDRDPGARWSMADAAQALRRLAERGDAAAQDTAVMAAPPPEESTRPQPSATRTPAAPLAPAPVGSGSEERERSRRTAPWLVGAALVLLVILGVGFMMVGGEPEGEEGRAATSEETSPPPKQEKPSPSPERESESPTPEPSDTPQDRPAQDENPGEAMENDVEEYFSFMPQNTDAGWDRLAPSMQAQGRDDYEQWWGSIESVDLRRADAVDGQRQVEIDLTYYFKDGTAKQEIQRLTLEKSGDRYLIADDEVLSSRTVS